MYRVVEAMATINPQLCKKLQIQVEVRQGNEGPIPHIHIFHDNTRNSKKCSVVRLDRAEYLPGHFSLPLKGKVKDQFLKVMNSKWGRPEVLEDGTAYTLTGYERAVEIWCDTHEDGSYSKFNLDEKGIPVIPDYELL